MLYVFFILSGATAGLLSGLLGIGGGVIVVPMLALLFKWQGFASTTIMHMAAGTSLAVMIATTSRSLASHLKRKIKFWSIYKTLAPSVIIGTMTGAIAAHFIHSDILKIIFGIFVLVVAAKMLLNPKAKPTRQLPGMMGRSIIGFIIGGKSGLLGIGGGALTIPILTHCNVNMRRAVVISVATGLTVATIGTCTFILTGLHTAHLPAWSLGYVYTPAWPFVAGGSALCAPLGVMLSHKINTAWLKRIFAVFLVIVGVHMLI